MHEDQPHSGLALVDTHAHLDEIGDVQKAVSEAVQAGVIRIIAVGQDYASNVRTLDLADKHKGTVLAALGMHPWNLGSMSDSEVNRNLGLIEDNISKIVAVGEVGLDYHKRVREHAGKGRQKEVFRLALGLARKHGKPVSVHSRYSWKDSFDLVQEAGLEKAVFHWYTGLSSVLRQILAEGYFISATPAAEYHYEHRRAIREAPIENLLLETDTPVRYGEAKWESMPADVVRSLEAVSELKEMEKADVAQITTKNAFTFFELRQES